MDVIREVQVETSEVQTSHQKEPSVTTSGSMHHNQAPVVADLISMSSSKCIPIEDLEEMEDAVRLRGHKQQKPNVSIRFSTGSQSGEVKGPRIGDMYQAVVPDWVEKT